MALLSVIRRCHFRDQLSIREISRRTRLSRNTVRKYLRSDTVEPAFQVPERPSKLYPFADKLSVWLRAEAAKSRKQKRTIKQLHADLVSLGFDGSYGRVATFARDWMRMPHDPEYALRNQSEAKPLLGTEAEHLLVLDTTYLTAAEASGKIAEWAIEQCGRVHGDQVS